MSNLVETDAGLKEILTETRTIALVGASDKGDRPSHGVMKFLQKKGYKVHPVNPRLAGQTLLGEKVFARVTDIPGKIDMVDIFRRADAVMPIVDDAIAAGAGAVWMQLGVINGEAAEKAHAAGLKVVMNHCPAIEIPRLGL